MKGDIQVQIKLTSKSSKLIYRMNRALDKNHNIGYPHITLFVGPYQKAPEVLKILNGIRDSFKSFKIFVSGVGSWNKRWVYFKVRKTEELKRLNRIFYYKGTGGISKDFEPGRWVPHITVAENKAKFRRILKAARDRDLEFEEQVHEICVVRSYGNKFRTIKRYKLRKL